MRRNRIQGKVWPPTTHCCHERWNGERCKLEKTHTEYVPSKNPLIERLNGWHQSRSGAWKGDTFLTWPQFETFRIKSFEEASLGEEEAAQGTESREAAEASR